MKLWNYDNYYTTFCWLCICSDWKVARNCFNFISWISRAHISQIFNIILYLETCFGSLSDKWYGVWCHLFWGRDSREKLVITPSITSIKTLAEKLFGSKKFLKVVHQRLKFNGKNVGKSKIIKNVLSLLYVVCLGTTFNEVLRKLLPLFSLNESSDASRFFKKKVLKGFLSSKYLHNLWWEPSVSWQIFHANFKNTAWEAWQSICKVLFGFLNSN